MKKLNILILCLLVSFKVTSQIDTKSKFVVLTEDQAKSVIKDLSRYDDLVKIDSLNNEKIKGLEDISCLKDDIISSKDEIIKEKDKIIAKTRRVRFGIFVGLQYISTGSINPYTSLMLQFKKINVSARYYPSSKYLSLNNDIRYSVNVEYKIF